VSEEQPPKLEDNTQIPFIEPHTHSFILKLWLLKQEGTKAGQNWRGHITHVASDQRIYFGSFWELNRLLISYMQKMGVKLPFWWRAYQWLKQ
jgi:hypothetical protein